MHNVLGILHRQNNEVVDLKNEAKIHNPGAVGLHFLAFSVRRLPGQKILKSCVLWIYLKMSESQGIASRS